MTVELSMEIMYIGFMFIGTLFYYRYKDLVSRPVFWIVLVSITAMTLVSWDFGYFSAQFFYPVTANYLYALAIFGLAYFFRDRFRPIFVVDWIASISYPLYLVHAVVGYALLQYLMGAWGWSFAPAIAVSVATAIGIAQLLHQTVETKSHQWGRRFASHPSSLTPSLA